MAIGILAYGSLLDDPGDELGARIVRRSDGLRTPFSVEYARSSRSRDGAPTLVPVSGGGSAVGATLLELDSAVDEATARTLLFRRESRRADARATPERPPWIRSIDGLDGVETCLYIALEPNLPDPNPQLLAELAVRSAARASGRVHRDGISYLDAQVRRGATTPLTAPYVAAVLASTSAGDLAEAWRLVRAAPDRFDPHRAVHRLPTQVAGGAGP